MAKMTARFVIVSLLTVLSLSITYGQLRYVRSLVPATLTEEVEFSAIAVSQFGDIYLLESRRHEIYHLNPQGEVLQINGGFGWEEGQLDTPRDLGLGSGLDVFVCDYNNHRIVRYDRRINYLAQYPDPNREYEIAYPISLLVNPLGEIYILDGEKSEINRLQIRRRELTPFAGVEYGEYGLIEPVMLRAAGRNRLAVLEREGRILIFDWYGTPLSKIEAPPAVDAIGFVAMSGDFILLNRQKPYLNRYSGTEKIWRAALILEYDKSPRFVAGVGTEQHLYLLKRGGEICLFEIVDRED